MKRKLLTAVAVLLSCIGYAQTKGTSTIGFGANVQTVKNEMNTSDYTRETSNKLFSLSYGYFVEDNKKWTAEISYGNSKILGTNGSEQTSRNIGGNIIYQRYYPIVKTFFAFAGGQAGYSRLDNESPQGNPVYHNSIDVDQYSVGAFGGLAWFLSKRFAFETTLLSANANYANFSQESSGDSVYSSKQTNFNISTTGFINNLGFKIFLLF